MATRNSIPLLRLTREHRPELRVVAVGVVEEDEDEIIACAEAGVAGYHLRADSLDDLFAVIQKVLQGEFVCSPGISAVLIRRVSALAAQTRPPAPQLALTNREVEILRMLERGLSNRDIAGQLSIAVHTVKNHVHSVLRKLGVRTRHQAAALSRTLDYEVY
ncbi:LuxR C-terminal-related transcriptional regulator [Mycolicibacterium thermoresistibile]